MHRADVFETFHRLPVEFREEKNILVIAAGDNFKRRLHDEIGKCDELLALFTPWSRRRAWVRHEIGMADMLRKRIVCVFYKVAVEDFQGDEDGLGPLDGLNTIELNNLSTYLSALRRRVG